jgi:hypothetical protein
MVRGDEPGPVSEVNLAPADHAISPEALA